ncbi:MAG: PQQ-binding-like beta-propeller repeat protein [Acidobacteriota bacterium]
MKAPSSLLRTAAQAVALSAAALLLIGANEPEVSMLSTTDAEVSNWPRWRGPSGQGAVAGDGYVDRWSPTDNVVWSTDVPGRGNSSPIVWGDRLFLTTAEDGGKRRSLLAFDRSDGTLAWRTEAPAADPEAAYPKNGHASSTPATDGKLIYTYFGSAGLVAFDFDGKVRWHVTFDDVTAFHGTASSPLLYEDSVILVQDHRGPSGSFIAAFDKSTGEQRWRTAREAKVGWNSPVAVRVGDHDEIVMSGQQKVTGYDPKTGEELWFATGNTFETIPTPVVAHGLIFCSSGRAGPTLAIRPGGRGDVTETHIVWSSPKGSPFVPAPIVVGDHLFMVNDMASIATVYEARTGEVVWQERLGEARRESFSAAPVAFDGKVFFTNDDGDTFVLRAEPPFEVLHVNSLDEQVIASPALVDGVWYLRTATRLYALGA